MAERGRVGFARFGTEEQCAAVRVMLVVTGNRAWNPRTVVVMGGAWSLAER